MNLRVHTLRDTLILPVRSDEHARAEVERFIEHGIWFGDTFYPPHAIMQIEIERGGS